MKTFLILAFLLGSGTWCRAQDTSSNDSRSDQDSVMKARLEQLSAYRKQQRIYRKMYANAPREAVDSAVLSKKKANATLGKSRLEAYRMNDRIDTLRKIDLSYAGLEEVPEFVFEAEQLEVLVLDYNDIRKLPKKLDDLPALKRIYWRANHLDNYWWIRIQKISGLEKLDISNNLLTRLPTGVKNLEGLEELVVEENFLGEVPVRRLKRADFIQTISFNSAHDFSIQEDDYEKINFIEIFKANQCDLEELHPSFYQIHALKELQLQENQLADIPVGISALTSLNKLSFYKNQLTHLPKDLFDLNLEVIDLYYNELEVIPEAIGKMKDLKILFLSNNKLYSLPESLGNLTDLEELYLHHNRLSVLPASLSGLKQLEVARVNANYLVDFPRQFLDKPHLRDLDVSDNQIKTIPPEVADLETLKLFTYHENPIDFNAPENAHLSPMIVEMMDQGVTCVPRVYQEEVVVPAGE